MGGKSKKVDGNSDFDPRYWSGWVVDQPCGHPSSKWFTRDTRWLKVKMTSGGYEGLLTTGRVLAGILTLGITEAAVDKKDLTHECVLVWVECRECARKFACTYEIMNADGKDWEWGRYQNAIERRETLTTELDFDFIHEQCYPRMWDNYRAAGHCCYHWARDFMCKLRNKDPSSYVYGRNG